MKEQPKAATGHKKDTIVESEQPPSNNSDKRDKLKWALVGSLIGIGGSIPASFMADQIKYVGDATPCSDFVRFVLSFVVFLIILYFSNRIAK